MKLVEYAEVNWDRVGRKYAYGRAPIAGRTTKKPVKIPRTEYDLLHGKLAAVVKAASVPKKAKTSKGE